MYTTSYRMDYQKPASNIALAPLEYFTNPSSRTFLLYLATSLLIAVVVHLKQARALKRSTGVLAGLFPKEVYTHTSAKVDYIYFILNSCLYAVILARNRFFHLRQPVCGSRRGILALRCNVDLYSLGNDHLFHHHRAPR